MKVYAQHSDNKTRTLDAHSGPSKQAPIEKILQTYQNATFEMPSIERKETKIQKEKNSSPDLTPVVRPPLTKTSPTLQRAKITLSKGLINGSEDNDSPAFWTDFTEKYKREEIYWGLKELIHSLQLRWTRRELDDKDWERSILCDAIKTFEKDSHYNYFQSLKNTASDKIKALFEPEGPTPPEKDVIPQEPYVSTIANSLASYASTQLTYSAKNDRKDITDLEAYTNILQRAVEIISQQYGLKIMYASLFNGADDSVLENLKQVQIHHSSERWEKASEAEIMEEGLAAIQWSMSNDSVTKAWVEKAGKFHNISFHKTIASYSDYYADNYKTYTTMYNNLAKVRLTWGPITYGKDIYLHIPTRKIQVADQWILLKTLIHETLHAIEHPNFTSFFQHNIPIGLQSDLREGITEYLTETIWTELISTLPITPKDTLSDLSKTLSTTKSRKPKLSSPYTQYVPQVRMINDIIKILNEEEGNGTDRLKEAYFSGNIEAFLPALIGPETEKAGEGMDVDEEMEMELDEGMEMETEMETETDEEMDK